MNRVLVINGPNLNLLGVREPDVYGSTTLQELETRLTGWGNELGIGVETFQSNHEGAIIDAIHRARGSVDGVVLNAGALTHYSYAIHDAIIASELPTIEIHISNIHAREPWRRESVTAPACEYAIYGRGTRGYRDALVRLVNSSVFPPERVAYGPGSEQYGELRVPPGTGPHPVAVLFHGGFWYDPWTLDLMDGLAIDLVERGWAAWNLEYRRVGSGGGFPLTMEDAAAGLDALHGIADAQRLDLSRVVAVGHSAGAQLALWAAGDRHLYDGQPTSADPVMPTTIVSLAGMTDLDMGHRMELGVGSVEKLLRRTPQSGADRYELVSPKSLVPFGVRQVVAHGTEDEVVPPEMSRGYAAAAREAGDEVDVIEIDGADHFDIIDPLRDAWQQVATRLSD